jgi:hypothetical protein
MATTPSNKKQVMDVAKPGKTAPDATTRPLIVGHGGMLKDPMMSAGSEAATTDEPTAKDDKTSPAPKLHAGGKVVQPISLKSANDTAEDESKGPEAADKDTTATDDSTEVATSANDEAQTDSDDGVAVDQKSETDAENSDKLSDDPTESKDENSDTTTEPEADDAKKSEDYNAQSDDEDSAVINAVADQAVASKNQKKEDKELLERQQRVAKLIQDKTYFVPIKQASKARKGRWLTGIIVALLVLLVGGYAAVDAGIVKPGFDVPIHFLKKDAPTPATTTPAATTPVAQPPAASTPTSPAAGLSNYTSKDYGVAFSYPSAWGDVTAKKTAGTISGNAVTFTFSKQPMLLAGMLSKDYKENGRDGTCFLLQGIMPTVSLADIKSMTKEGDASSGEPVSNRMTTKVLKSGTDTFVYETFEAGEAGMGSCMGVAVFGYKSFTTGSYTGIQFLWAKVNLNSVPLTDFAKYKANPNDFLSDKDRKDLLATVDSAKTQ